MLGTIEVVNGMLGRIQVLKRMRTRAMIQDVEGDAWNHEFCREDARRDARLRESCTHYTMLQSCTSCRRQARTARNPFDWLCTFCL